MEIQLKQNKKGFGLLLLLIVVPLVLVLGYVYRSKIQRSFDPIAIVANVVAAELKEADGRTNILIMGSDKRTFGSEYSNLTDTLLVASISKVDKDVVLVSVPRDLWVKLPGGGNSKINAVYSLTKGSPYVSDQYQGANGTKKALEEVLGIPIHYHVLVNFDLFTQAVDLLGGVDVVVENAFTDRFYPIEGKENAPENERYETISFTAGKQTMAGETALKYVRSRKGDNNEGTDFARSKRQQKVIAAIKDKALSIHTLINPAKLKDLYELYAKNVDTDIDLGTIQNFYILSQQISFDKITSIVLDDRSEANEGGLLYHPEDAGPYGGAYVLTPKTGDYNYSQIHAFVQKYLFSSK